MKKIILVIIALFMLSATGFAQSGTTGPLTWDLSNGTLTVSGEGAMPNYVYVNSGYIHYDAPWYSYNFSITTVLVETGVTSIGDGAFYYCDGLTSVTIGNSVTSIGDWGFYGCSGLTSVTIPNSVTSIGEYAFSRCSKLTSITIPNSVTSIGDEAFRYCLGLTSVTIGNSVTSIGNLAFSSCHYLTSVTIPESVTSIGDGAFYYCSKLTSVTIGNSVTSIGDEAFRDCSKLTSITNFNPAPQSINSNVFYNVNLSKVTLYVPASSVKAYEATTIWNYFGNIVPLFHVSITANNPSMGTVAGTGNYAENSTVTISATVKPGYRFVKWGDNNTQNPRTITVTKDITYKAILEVITYHVTVNASNTSMGTVTGTGYYAENNIVTISAIANQGYKFVKWDDDNTQNPRTITVTHDINYTAEFDVNTNIHQTLDNDVSIYPNPVTESFRINGITAPTEVTLTDLSGRIVLQQTVEAGESVAVGNLPNGIYIVRIEGKTVKVVKR
ncbi:MAG: leucine-rich repeat protein [Dysgonamonadaceae bacterium]|jgi:hypothetical protein|nr:leucine-rich repeat protein [Dysgonamonadaceae bacterium]